MGIALLLRHGRTTANTEGVLAGWTPGIHLDPTGVEQAARLGQRLAGTPVTAVVSSPLERCRETAQAVLEHHPEVALQIDEAFGEARYGAWTGRPLKELATEPLWRDVQERPSTVTFPAHDDYPSESMTAMQERAVTALARWDQAVTEQHGPGAVWVAVSHGDVIKALLADALATELDRFQRIVVDPGSLSIVRAARRHPFVVRVNDTGSDALDLTGLTRAAQDDSRGDADIGGGAGTG